MENNKYTPLREFIANATLSLNNKPATIDEVIADMTPQIGAGTSVKVARIDEDGAPIGHRLVVKNAQTGKTVSQADITVIPEDDPLKFADGELIGYALRSLVFEAVVMAQKAKQAEMTAAAEADKAGAEVVEFPKPAV